MPNDLLTTDEMSLHLATAHGIRITAAALVTRRCIGIDGPEFIRIGRAVRYRRSAGDDYAKRAMSGPLKSTKQQPAAAEAVAA